MQQSRVERSGAEKRVVSQTLSSHRHKAKSERRHDLRLKCIASISAPSSTHLLHANPISDLLTSLITSSCSPHPSTPSISYIVPVHMSGLIAFALPRTSHESPHSLLLRFRTGYAQLVGMLLRNNIHNNSRPAVGERKQ